MKKLLLSIVFLLGIWVENHAQNTFAPIGAEWYSYQYSVFGSPSKLEHATRGNDTIVQGKQAFLINTERKYSGSTVYYHDTALIFYQNADTVFVYNNIFNRFTPLYVFNVNDGDTVCLPVPPYSNDFRIHPYTGDTSFCFVVDSVRMRLYDTSLLKTVYCSTIESEENFGVGDYPIFNWGFRQGYYNEVFGGKEGFLPIPVISTLLDYLPDWPALDGILQCYSDGGRSIKLVTIECDSLIPAPTNPIGIYDIKSDDYVKIYPNPATNKLYIELSNNKQPMSLSLTDMQGRSIIELCNWKSSDAITTLDVSNIATGIYYLQCRFKEGVEMKKIIISVE